MQGNRRQFFSGRRILFFLIPGFLIGAAAILFCLHDFVPGGQAMLDILVGKGAFGRRQNEITVKVDGQEQTVRTYVANLYPDGNRSGKERTVILTGLVLKKQEDGKPETVNWKVGRDFVGVTHDHEAVFLPARWGLLAGEGIHTTYPIEDDTKGFDAEYTIVDHGSFLNYSIVFPSGKETKTIVFPVPKEMLGIRNATHRKPLHVLPYRLREKAQGSKGKQETGRDASE